jgi:hypothetical protein
MYKKEKVVGDARFKLSTELDYTQTITWSFSLQERKSGR